MRARRHKSRCVRSFHFRQSFFHARSAERRQRRENLATMTSKPNSKLETRNWKPRKVNLSCGISCE